MQKEASATAIPEVAKTRVSFEVVTDVITKIDIACAQMGWTRVEFARRSFTLLLRCVKAWTAGDIVGIVDEESGQIVTELAQG